MQYRPDLRSGNSLSVLGFGCMRLPRGLSGIDMKKSEQIIMQAIERGVNYFDAAYIYPGSEAALGQVLINNNARDRVYIATKLPIVMCRKHADFDRFLNEQLKNLKTDYIDYYLMHNINSLRQWQKLCELGIEEWLSAQRQAGKIRRIGFSFHGHVSEFMAVIDAYDWDFCQIQYNYSNENYQAGVAGLRRAAEKQMPVIIMEPLLGGKLATGLPKQAEAVFKSIDPNRSCASWGLRWLLNQPEVTVILSGMNSEMQVSDNLATADTSSAGMLTAAEKSAYQQVNDIFRASYKVPCTGCGYCTPCPQSVNIPECFAAYNASYSLGLIQGYIQYATGTAVNRKDHHMANRCIDCGKCEKHCPQEIKIREELKRVRRRMEPWPYTAVLSIIRRRG